MSWTLMLLGAGIVMGCLNAWYWVKKESGGE
jgi:ATP synthase protein I